MTQLFSQDDAQLFEEIVEKGREEGVTTQEGYHELIDVILESHRDVGESHDDESEVDTAEMLRGRFQEYLEAAGLNKKHPTI